MSFYPPVTHLIRSLPHRLHHLRQPIGRFKRSQQVKVIRHQHLSMDSDLELLRVLKQQVQQGLVIRLRSTNSLTVVPPLDDVVRVAREG